MQGPTEVTGQYGSANDLHILLQRFTRVEQGIRHISSAVAYLEVE
jgi:hypothetical protein